MRLCPVDVLWFAMWDVGSSAAPYHVGQQSQNIFNLL
jgi:hypothetical protein